MLKEWLIRTYVSVKKKSLWTKDTSSSTESCPAIIFSMTFWIFNIEKQKEKIRKEKNFLEDRLDTTIYTFIPPWNQYDQNTLKVLDSFNFRCISAGIRGPSNDKPTKINLIPNTCGLNNVLEGIEAARNSDEKLSLIVALFHIYHFIEDKSTKGYLNIQDLSDILNWVSKQPDVKTMTINKAVSELPSNFLTIKYEQNKKNLALTDKSPPFLESKRDYTYASESY